MRTPDVTPTRDPRHEEAPSTTLDGLLPGASARVAAIASPSLRPLLARLGVTSGACVRCHGVTSTMVVLAVGPRVVAVPRIWAATVSATPMADLADVADDRAAGGVRAPKIALTSEERAFASGDHLLLG